MQDPIPILPAQQLAAIYLASAFTLRFSILGTGTNNGNIVEIAAADHSLTLLSVSSTATRVVHIDYTDGQLVIPAYLLPADWQTAWTTIEITVSMDRISFSSSFNSTPTVVTGISLFDNSGILYVVQAASDSRESAGGFIRDVEISGILLS